MSAQAQAPAPAAAARGVHVEGPRGRRLAELGDGPVLSLELPASDTEGAVALLAAHVRVAGPAGREALAVTWWELDGGPHACGRPLDPLARVELRMGPGVVFLLAADPLRRGEGRCYGLTVAPAAAAGESVLELADAFGAAASLAELGQLRGLDFGALADAIAGRGTT